MAAEHDRWGSVRQLAAEREIILAAAITDHWTTLIHTSSLTPAQGEQVIASYTFRALCEQLHHAHVTGRHPETLLGAAIRAGHLDQAPDPAALLCRRNEALNAKTPTTPRHPGRLVAGIIPDTDLAISTATRTAIDHYNTAITRRATHRLSVPIRSDQPWTRTLGARPSDLDSARRWDQAALATAAHMAFHRNTDTTPSGHGCGTPNLVQGRDLTGVRALIVRPQTPHCPAPTEPSTAPLQLGL
ncbi:MAG: hypothetical protein LBH48_03055 [Bifidobacteriaceae bacterium]|nr:hypothetical protein [Bifidobacteriaceae bacterium]